MRWKNLNKREKMGYLFLLPSVVLMIAFIIYPVINTVYLSFFNYRVQTMSMGKTFVGVKNFIMAFKDPNFLGSFKFTITFTVVAVTLETLIGILFALIMNKKIPGQGIIRTSVLIPWAIPTIVSALMWKFMYSEQYGVINFIFQKLHIVQGSIPWLSDASLAVIATIIADVWKTTPYMSLLILSGLQTIPKNLYEASSIDGANKRQQFFKITLPLLKPVLSVAILFRVIATFRIYDLVAALTSGGPANSTQSLSLYTIRTYFNFGNIGYGSALATITLLISLLISLLFLNALKTKIEKVA
ncbi:sugar ABC transporter permease [Oceanotoga sp. DSM 15011]|jgi:multiple sugar transport system permease protein|uniref:Carbohydrate ABC transporter membrane protein 1 (CUT1 family) n=1 Tax=Oceanotoga teriensis TaxID=515440 RepID=A0AA45C6J0_9BACT|nr:MULTISPECIES: sugar ABC transporter permease [Oceanotoga]MDN5343726.1 trehalose/maltose transport system permease protein [Oceanotoga sp.]MDO7976633.1 sugar ABC transporter permease [Oceanotoga teriensis]PWJ92128.1 carbohydrate ABC transporter membrane protein 1 (CUT1 family) [Oceanotoga teriensis]UYO99350.1 sugar ABC transporter permease [Oceanotoga sp. DSM 15011]